jgi:hypothetical protein
MFSNKYILKMLAAVALVTLIASCSDNEALIAESTSSKPQPITLDVYKSPTCGCCKKWMNHIDDNGFQSKAHNRNDVSIIKQKKVIATRYRSFYRGLCF